MENGCLALYFGYFFLLGFFFLLLELELVTDELEDGHLGVVADAVPRMDDAGVAAGAIREFWRDLAEQLLRNGRKHDVGSRLTARLQRVPLAERNHLLCNGPGRFGTRQRGSNSPVLEQIGDQAAQHRAAVIRLLSEFITRVEMSHRCPLKADVLFRCRRGSLAWQRWPDDAAVLVELHAQREAHLHQYVLNLVERLAAEVFGLQHFVFALLYELADGLDVRVLQAI